MVRERLILTRLISESGWDLAEPFRKKDGQESSRASSGKKWPVILCNYVNVKMVKAIFGNMAISFLCGKYLQEIRRSFVL